MNYKKLLVYILIIIAPLANAAEYSFLIDRYESPYAGATYAQSFFTAYKELDDIYIPSSEGKRSFLWGVGRFGKLYLEMYLATFLLVGQHEIFGHGYRAREFGFTGIGYQVGFTGGYTSFSEADFNRLNRLQQAELDAGGMEADTVLSQQIRESWFTERTIDNRDALFYFLTATDQPFYVLGTADNDTNQGNDVNAYVIAINQWYGSQAISKHRMRGQQIWNLLDPTLYFSLYSMGKYIGTGCPTMRMFMFDVYGYDYLPTPRVLLAPWGPEFQLQNHVVTPWDQYVRLNLRYGSTSFIRSYGIDLMLKPIWQYKEFTFGNKIYLWRQPDINSPYAQLAHNKYGAAAFVNAEYKFDKHWYGLTELGYKTSGFIEGNPLGYGWVWRLGFKYAV